MSDGYFRGPSTKKGVRIIGRFFITRRYPMIDFKTYDEQIDILQNRGMIINNPNIAKSLLKINNYYNLINGYKDIFVQPGISPEVYIKGVTFDEVYALHQFDKELRLNFSHILIVVERTFASILSHEFSRICPNHDLDYLNINKYNTTITETDTAGTSIIAASQLITDKKNKKGLSQILDNAINNNDHMICHYKLQYNRVPFCVFVNKLSFGTLSKIFRLLQSQERDAIAKSIGQISRLRIYANDVQKAINVLVLLRNKCAHDQRIYDFTPGKTTIKNTPFISTYLSSHDNKHTLFGTMGCISLFLNPAVFNEFCKKIKKLTTTFLSSIHSIPTAKILSKMGVPQLFLS